MTSSFHHLSRSAALHISRKHCLRPAVSSVAPFRSYSSGVGGNHGFSTVTSNAPKDNGPVLSKADLAQIISAEHDLKMAESNRIIDTLLDTIVEVRALEWRNIEYFLSSWLGYSHVSCATCYDIFPLITQAVSKEGTVSVAGFGKFFNKKLEARDYRIPRTGETVFKGDRKVPKFKAFTNFKDCVEGTKSVKK